MSVPWTNNWTCLLSTGGRLFKGQADHAETRQGRVYLEVLELVGGGHGVTKTSEELLEIWELLPINEVHDTEEL